MVLQVRGVVLPERAERSLWIDGDRIRFGPGPEPDTVVAGGWILPGLVDAHTHPGTEEPTDSFDADLFRRHLISHREAGVLLIRAPGTAARVPDWADTDPELPRIQSAGRWLATPGRFFPGYGRNIGADQLTSAAVEEVLGSSGWCKLIGDWKPTDPPVPRERVTELVAAVHAIGGRVAVHCQTEEGCRNAVLAGADTLEHGMHLDPALLSQMAAQGTALVPTLSGFGEDAAQIRAGKPGPGRDWWLSGWDAMPPTVRAAHDAGVTVLAGTDSFAFGSITNEIRWLRKAGLPPEAAVGAASWTARTFLGLPGLVDGAPADLTVYDADPVDEPDVLDHPRRIILKGRVIR